MSTRTHHHAAAKPKTVFDMLVYFFAVAEPLMTFPQVLEIWVGKSAEGVSLWSWGFYLIAAVVFLVYNIRIKNRPLIIMYVLWLLMEIMIVVGILKYG